MNHKSIGQKNTTTKLVYISMLVAISFIGSLIKIQGTIALDSMPGFFAALYLGPIYGALVAIFGHLLTSLSSGFPLTIPIHLIIAFEMAIVVYLFGLAYKKTNGLFACILGIFLNGVAMILLLSPFTILFGLPLNGKAFVYAMMAPLTVGAAVNIGLGYIVYRSIGERV